MMTIEDCKDLERKIHETKDAIHNRKLEGQVASIQTGSETTSYHRNADRELETHLTKLELEYQSGSCAVVLGKPSESPTARGPIRPRF